VYLQSENSLGRRNLSRIVALDRFPNSEGESLERRLSPAKRSEVSKRAR